MSNYLLWLLLTAAVGVLLGCAIYRTSATRPRSSSQLANGLIVATLVVSEVRCDNGTPSRTISSAWPIAEVPYSSERAESTA